MKQAILLSFIVCAVCGCSSHPTEAEIASPSPIQAKVPGASIEAQQVAAEQKADFVAEISFTKKQKALNPVAQETIQKALKRASAEGKIEQIKVITWADAEFPSVHTKKLSKEEQQLANARNQEIESFIKKQKPGIKVKSYSMAERANALKDFIGSSEARIKKSLELAGIPTTDTSVKFPSKASKSILLIMIE